MIDLLIDFNQWRVILCFWVKESHSLYVHIHIFVQLVLETFFHLTHYKTLTATITSCQSGHGSNGNERNFNLLSEALLVDTKINMAIKHTHTHTNTYTHSRVHTHKHTNTRAGKHTHTLAHTYTHTVNVML